MKETMTIHKALSELKVLDSRIDKAIDACTVVVANKHNNSKIAGKPVADFVADAKESYQSAMTLINRRNAIKRAVTRSNAVTTVKIGNSEYTVAEAIDMKANGVRYLNGLTAKLSKDLAKAKAVADMENSRVDDRAEDYVRSLYQGADLKNMSDEIERVKDTFITAQTTELVDPINAKAEIDRLDAEISEFLSEVDSALSVSNALTTVEVEYETK